MIKVAVLDDLHDIMTKLPPLQRVAKRAELMAFTKPLAPPERAKALKGIEAVISLRERTTFDRAFFADAPDLRFIAQTGRPGPNFDIQAATEAGVLISTGGGGGPGNTSSNSTAELTFGLAIALMRGIVQGHNSIQSGGWILPYGIALGGKTLGIVGLGRIGSEIARLGNAFHMNVLAWSRSLTPKKAAQAGVEQVSIEDLFRRSDLVTVHLAANDGTRGLVNANLLRSMKPTAFFINTSRGRVTDEPALVELLQQRKIAGAGLDVFLEEPLPADHPLRKLDNVVVTPHMGWPADIGYANFAEGVAKAVEDYLDGNPSNLLNPEAREHVRV